MIRVTVFALPKHLHDIIISQIQNLNAKSQNYNLNFKILYLTNRFKLCNLSFEFIIMYTIVTTPATILSEIAKPVERFDADLAKILTNMEKTLRATKDPKGVGLAAPQVGLSLRIFQTKPDDDSPVTHYINPEILHLYDANNIPIYPNSEKVEKMKKIAQKGGPKPKKGRLLEGCLSIPNIWGNVSRYKKLQLVWQDESGKKHKKVFKGFPAIIVQHEMDHLNGILFTKHVIEQGEKLYRSFKNKEGEDEFEEIKI